ncbi:MAG: hypothetical protein AB7K09_02460 [Planctomycetota bacterium]
MSPEWTILVRVAWRVFGTPDDWSRSGTSFDLGYSFDQSGIHAAAVVQFRF